VSETLGTRHWPVEIRVKRAEKAIEIDFDDGRSERYPAEYLRVESPSAEVQGHGPDQRQTVAGKRFVGITKVEPVGHYAIRVHFDDGHNTGIFSWTYFDTLARERETRWAAYLQALDEKGLTRDPF
jgi:DUF971 family protein